MRASRGNARAAGVAQGVEFREQDLFATDLGRATVVTMYLLPVVNLQLRPRLLALAPGTRIVSHDWDMGDWLPDRTIQVDVPDKALGREKFSRVHLWRVPARVSGRWCAAGTELEISQRFQRFSATLTVPGSAAPPSVFDGRIDATMLLAEGTGAFTLRLDGERLVAGAAMPGAPVGQAFLRSRAARCG